MYNAKQVTPQFIDEAKTLKGYGLTRKQIASRMGVSYATISKIFGSERLGIDRAHKAEWTIENLTKLRDNYKTLPIKELCRMFNRDRGEIRQLLSHLGWDIPIQFIRRNKEQDIEKVKFLHEEYNQSEISRITGIPKSQVQAICYEYGLKCSTKRHIGKDKKTTIGTTNSNLTTSEYISQECRKLADGIRSKYNNPKQKVKSGKEKSKSK